jgi:hypothetical protein
MSLCKDVYLGPRLCKDRAACVEPRSWALPTHSAMELHRGVPPVVLVLVGAQHAAFAVTEQEARRSPVLARLVEADSGISGVRRVRFVDVDDAVLRAIVAHLRGEPLAAVAPDTLPGLVRAAASLQL